MTDKRRDVLEWLIKQTHTTSELSDYKLDTWDNVKTEKALKVLDTVDLTEDEIAGILRELDPKGGSRRLARAIVKVQREKREG